MGDAATQSQSAQTGERAGLVLVFLAALCWSFGGAIARFIEAGDSWTVVFWRSVWASGFLLAFMLLRDGPKGTRDLFTRMGLPGLAVAVCFATASTCFVVALAYTSVANVLLLMASAPLLAALLSFLVLGEKITGASWAAIGAVLVGVGIMVSDSLTGAVSPIGDGLAFLIAFVFAVATVITRRYAHVRMTPATCLGTFLAACFAASMAGGLATSSTDMGYLIVFGAVNLGLGLAFFATGARLIPAAIAALLSVFENVLGPVWVWLFHDEVPTGRTMVGGAVVLAALLAHLGVELGRSRPRRPGVTGIPSPH